jgi:uncharacterized protein (DUF1810 family)
MLCVPTHREADMANNDPFDLQRFVQAQAPLYDGVLAELRAGRKRTHWMWFIFPQHRALGRSHKAFLYGITGLDEARAYLEHAELAPRLRECTEIVLASDAASLYALFGTPDDMKFRSSMTLFECAAESADHPFGKALDRWCEGRRDEHTLAALLG